MASFLLPDRETSERLEASLAADRIVAFVNHDSPSGPILRVCVAWYVTRADVDRLIGAVARAVVVRTAGS